MHDLLPFLFLQLNEVEVRCPNVDFPSVPRADPHPQELRYLPSQISHDLNLLMGAIQYGEATVETVGNIGTASNEAEKTVASSLFCVHALPMSYQ